MKKILVVIDVQNDFITGSLKNEEAVKAVPNIVKKINEFDGDIIFATKDTHFDNYLETLEGKHLDTPHCIRETWGWEIESSVDEALNKAANKCEVVVIEKPTFGSFDLLQEIDKYEDEVLNIEFVGFCTDICVVSNVLLTKAAFYANANISVDSSCCAGVFPSSHEAALTTMRMCQINVI